MSKISLRYVFIKQYRQKKNNPLVVWTLIFYAHVDMCEFSFGCDILLWCDEKI